MLLQCLALLKGFDIAAMDTQGADFVHVVAEAMKLSFADRDVYYGDPRFCDVPMERLQSDAYNAERRQRIRMDRASTELGAGRLQASRRCTIAAWRCRTRRA
ncbi:gamma-glutamyltranspeptidase [Aureimonas pseudogalii]|uniref:Gamma-glutamyltranspeptidase n=1 Tax=Aureimonas pseudogalii TaxID=1744844 RepID=A0A7W6MM55_9HYPH|nr:gamma-glutamyltranspeptidase [Aureimonas pseudogalii]